MYQLFFPAPDLRPFIECYWLARAPEGQSITLRENVFVDGKADILFNFGVAYQRRRLDSSGVEQALPASNLDAQRRYPVAIHQQGAIDLVGVRFRPGGLAAFVPIPAHLLTNETFDLMDNLGGVGRELEGRLFDVRGESALQVALLDSFFLSQLTSTPAYALARYLAGFIEDSSGKLGVHALSRETGYSIRTVDRLFRQSYGFSPKFYARIIRFQHALKMILHRPTMGLLSVALGCGYYDQSHFNKDFADLTGDSPEHYRAQLLTRAASPPPNLSDFYKSK